MVMARMARLGRAGALVILPLLLLLTAAACAYRERNPPLETYREGVALEAQKKPWDAILHYRTALQADPKNTEIRLRLADLLMDTGDYGSAERNYRTILDSDPANTAAINNLSWLYTITGWHLDWAIKAMKPLVEKPSPHRHVYLDTLGMVHVKRKEFKEAQAAFQEAADLCRQGAVMSTSDECAGIGEHLKMAKARR